MLNKAWALFRGEGFPRIQTRHMIATHLVDAEALDAEIEKATFKNREFFVSDMPGVARRVSKNEILGLLRTHRPDGAA